MDIIEKAYAKLNISLDIVARMADGYHDMRMIMQSIDLHDDVKIECRPGTGQIHSGTNLKFLPNDDKNIAVKAARIFLAASGIKDYDFYIQLTKRIPVCAGMGGGSSDGAAVLRGMNKLLKTGYEGDFLRKLAEKVGSDVPFCVQGGTSLAEGRGEKLTSLSPLPECYILVCKPDMSISTPQLFSKIRCNKIRLRPDTKGIIAALDSGDIDGIAKRMYNVFEPVLPANAREIFDIKAAMLDEHALGSVMTGTGSAVFGIFDSKKSAEGAYNRLSKIYNECHIARPTEKIIV